MKRVTSQPLHQTLRDSLITGKQVILNNPRRTTNIYLATLLSAAIAFLVLTPVGSGDTDLWYHMNGGRLLWEFRDFPNTAFFSFTEAQDTWVNYFWAFQTLSYQIHEFAGYEGLIALRVFLVGLTIVAICGLLTNHSDTPGQRAWAFALLVLVVMILMGRIDQIRPHLVSYMMIAVFLFILEHRPNWLPTLPLLTVAWINFHGVEWVVGAAICGAYLTERLWQWHKSGCKMDTKTRAMLIWIIACLPMLAVNPYGLKVLIAPFSTPPDVYHYIKELQPLSLAGLFSFSFSGPVLSVDNALSALFYGNLLAYGSLLLKGNTRPSALILSIVGMILLTQGQRFAWEWLLLSLPLWRNAIDELKTNKTSIVQEHIRISNIILVLLLIAPFVNWYLRVQPVQEWPLNGEKLPTGTATFIRTNGIQGQMMAPPNGGGYLAWRLYPRVLISADMQTPPSTPWTHFRIGHAMANHHALQRFIEEYAPELIAVEHYSEEFRNIIKTQPHYRPVFFGDLYVLYANIDLLPEVVDRHELKYVNPHNLLDDKLGTIEERLSELERVRELHRDGDRVQHSITRLLFDQERFEDALVSAQDFLKTNPDNPNSHYLMGNALENLNRCEEANQYYKDTFAVATADFRSVLHRHLGSCAYLLKDFAKAYRYFKEGINPYEAVEPEYRFQYALAAAAMGKNDKARMLLRQLLYTIDCSDAELIKKSQALLSDLE